MDTVQILAGAGFANAVRDCGLTSAQCTYHYQPPKYSCREDYQVWLLSKEDFDNLCSVDDNDWKEDWGWWRSSGGSTMGVPDSEFTVNGEKLLAWNGNQTCAGKISDQDECYGAREYEDILAYINKETGLSTETNICALCIDLARHNNLTLSELFKKYLGGDTYEND